MERPPDAIQKYLSAMKERTGMSWADLSAATRLPDSTIRKIFSGETADPRLETISLIVSALGGSLDTMPHPGPDPGVCGLDPLLAKRLPQGGFLYALQLAITNH